MRLGIALSAFALLLPACGGDGREEAVESARLWMTAVSDGKTEEACELMQPVAVDGLRKKLELAPKAECPAVVREYAASFGSGELDSIIEAGLEAEGTVKKDQIGVFPVSGPRELQVVLMRRVNDDWKVASTTIGLMRGNVPTPEPN
jgi:hypothetical protein